MSKIKITQIRGLAGRESRQRKTICCLGLGRIGKSREHTPNPTLLSMIKSVSHLIKVEQVK